MASNDARIRALALPLVVTVTAGCPGNDISNPDFVTESGPISSGTDGETEMATGETMATDDSTGSGGSDSGSTAGSASSGSDGSSSSGTGGDSGTAGSSSGG